MATLRGYWTEEDLKVKKKLSLYPMPEDYLLQISNRAAERRRIADLIARERVYDAPRVESELHEEQILRIVIAIHELLAKSPSSFHLVYMEDLLVEGSRVNVPGTVDEYPNWRLKLHKNLEGVFSDEFSVELCRRVSSLRKVDGH